MSGSPKSSLGALQLAQNAAARLLTETRRREHIRPLTKFFILRLLLTSKSFWNAIILYSLFTHDCRPEHDANTIIKFADDTTVIRLIKDNDESAYREEVDCLAAWFEDNNLLLNTAKTKELLVDFRKNAINIHPST